MVGGMAHLAIQGDVLGKQQLGGRRVFAWVGKSSQESMMMMMMMMMMRE